MQRKIIGVLLCAIGLILTFNYIGSVFSIASQEQDTDLKIMYLSGKMLNLHAPAYHFNKSYVLSHQFKSDRISSLAPPFTTLFATFVAKCLTYKKFFVLFFSITLILNMICLARLYRHFYQKKPLFLSAFILANFIYMPTMLNINFGQVALLLNILIISSYLALKKKQEKLAGFFLAIAANIKIFCGLFLLYLFFQKKKKAFFTMLLFCILFASIPLIIYGKSIYIGYLDILSGVHWYGTNWNASFYGFFARFLGDSNKKLHALLCFPKVAKFFYFGFFISYFFLMSYLSKKNESHPELLFSFTLSSMLIISPLGWNYYFPILVTALLINLNLARNDRTFLVAFCLMLFSIFLSSILFPIYKKYPSNPRELFFQGNIFFFALLLFNIATIILFFGKKTIHYMINGRTTVLIYSICLLPSLLCMLSISAGILSYLSQKESKHVSSITSDITH